MKNDKWVYLIGACSLLILCMLSNVVTYEIGKHKHKQAQELIYQMGWKQGVIAALKSESREQLDLIWMTDSIDFVELITFDK